MTSGLREDLVEGSEFRELFEYHRDRIAALFASRTCEAAVRLKVLDRLTEPPLTTAMAVARLKRYLPAPLDGSICTTPRQPGRRNGCAHCSHRASLPPALQKLFDDVLTQQSPF